MLGQFAEQVFCLTSSGCLDDAEAQRNGTGLASREFPTQSGVLSGHVTNITASLSSFLSHSFLPRCTENLSSGNREETRASCSGFSQPLVALPVVLCMGGVGTRLLL